MRGSKVAHHKRWPSNGVCTQGFMALALMLALTAVPTSTAASRQPVGQVIEPSVGPYLQDLEFDGPLDGAPRQSCMDLFIFFTQALACRTLPPPLNWVGPNVTAEVCELEGGDLVISIYTPRSMQGVFHAHLQGPQILVPPITSCAVTRRDDTHKTAPANIDPTAVHRFQLAGLLHGSYMLTLHAVTFGCTFGHHSCTPNRNPLWSVPITIENGSSAFSDGNIQSWPTCNHTFMHGTVLSKLLPTETLNSSHGSVPVAWREKLRWQPMGCNLLPFETKNVSSCLQQKQVCFVGDSHLRLISNGISCMADGLDLVNRSACNPADIYQHKNTKFYMVKLLEDGDIASLRLRSDLFAECTDIFFSSGSWQLSDMIRSQTRWTAGRFAKQVSAALGALKAVTPKCRHYRWVTMNAHGWIDNNQQSRLPPYTELFRHIGSALAARAGFSIVNTWDITAPLFNTSWDSSHHHYAGAAGHAITQYVLNVLCVQNHTHS